MKTFVLEDHKSLFRNDQAFAEFLGLIEAKVKEPGMLTIWGNEKCIVKALSPQLADQVIHDDLIYQFAADPTLAADIQNRILNDPIVE